MVQSLKFRAVALLAFEVLGGTSESGTKKGESEPSALNDPVSREFVRKKTTDLLKKVLRDTVFL